MRHRALGQTAPLPTTPVMPRVTAVGSQRTLATIASNVVAEGFSFIFWNGPAVWAGTAFLALAAGVMAGRQKKSWTRGAAVTLGTAAAEVVALGAYVEYRRAR